MSTEARTQRLNLRTKAIESLMIEKGFITEDVIDLVVRTYEEEIGPMRGAEVVARAWTDDEFRRWLLEDGTEALRSLGIEGFAIQRVVVVENTPTVHNVIVCTLCSCYPWGVLGLPPAWFKSPEFRGRIVREPRAVLREFGLDLSDDIEVRVWDSSSEVRYMVLPERPAGTDGMSMEELVPLITRDSMIGTAFADAPAA